jgi:protein-L-isoaspartate(D-aspartate) O-methyltransferase
MADLVGDGGYVVGVEHIQPLRDLGDRNMRKSEEGRRLVESGKARFVVADGRQGYDDPSPDLAAQVADKMGQEKWDVKGWDIIHVGAGAVKLHEALIEQLRRPGRMFIPVDEERGYGQSIWVVEKGADGRVERKRLYAVQYVPLTDPHNDPY